MRIDLLLVCFLLLWGCANDSNTKYVQQQEISMAPPRIKTTSTIIDSTVTVSAHLGLKGVKIFYSSDGREPTQQSMEYKKPLSITKAGNYKFRAFHPNWKTSNTVTLKLYKQGLLPNSIEWHSTAHESYPGKGATTLSNNEKGILDFKDSQWIGFDSVTSATVHFDNKPCIKSITLGYLVDTASWIFPPEHISLYLNGQDTIQVKLDTISNVELKTLEDVIVPIGKGIDSILVEVHNTKKLPEWHLGRGKRAWLFMDEWIFNE